MVDALITGGHLLTMQGDGAGFVEDGAVIQGPVQTGPQVGRAPGPPSDPALPVSGAASPAKKG